MIPRESHMVYALRHNEIVHISEVKRGLACNCTCPACHARLVAKKEVKGLHILLITGPMSVSMAMKHHFILRPKS